MKDLEILNQGIEASVYMRQLTEALQSQSMVFTERAALKLAEQPLKLLKDAQDEDKLAFVFEALNRLPRAESLSLQLALKGIASNLLRGGLPLNSLDAVRLVESVTHQRQQFPYKSVLSALEDLGMTPALRQALLQLRSIINEWHGSREMQEIHSRIDALVNGPKEQAVEAVASWSRQVFQEIDRSPKQMAWRALFLHARSLTQSSASRKWQNEASALIGKIGNQDVLEAARRWLALGPMPGAAQSQVPDEEAQYQKGFIWALGALGDSAIAPDLADFALACFRKIPQIGAVSHLAGNACVNALSALPGLDAVSQLSRLATRVKYDVARRLIEKALVAAAERNNVRREDLEAMSVPSCSLDAEGVHIQVLGDCVARLAIEEGKAALSWTRDGKPVKSVSTDLKENHAEALAEIKKAAKELDAVLSTQRIRLERQLLSPSSCPFPQWKAWYLDHPVTSGFAKCLIWEIETAGESKTAIWWNGNLIDWSGREVTTSETAMVRLWHPIRSDVQTVLSWRCWLEDQNIRQPFKQAHREVYLLTEAERQTETYSNRFAAHIIRQHQFAALCRERGWQFHLMGHWDSHNTPCLDLPQHQLRAEFEIEFPESGEASGHAVYFTICTDRVQFFDASQKTDGFVWPPPPPIRLEEVPALVFSEVMRDVDLFIGVTSIGSDPSWGALHRQEPGLDAEYWNHFAFGALSEAAENRRTIIQNLLPKLAIRERCRLEGRFLVVKGDLHEYRIHIGSGNILMEPGSRYLCIVPGPADPAAKLPLPFDGDRVLGIILSKALLLVNDTAIKDETIQRQLR